MIKDDKITLEPFTEKDFDRFINWIDIERFMCQFAGTIFTFPLTCQQLSNYVSAANRKIYKVMEVETGRVIGHAEMDRLDPRNRSTKAFYSVSRLLCSFCCCSRAMG